MESALQFATPLPEAAELCGADGPRCGQLPAEARRAEQGRAAGERAEQGRTTARPRARPRRGHGGAEEALAGRGERGPPSALRGSGRSSRRSCSAELCAGQPRRVTAPPSLPLGRHAVGPPAPPRHAELHAGPPRRRTEEEEPQSRPTRRVPAPSHHDAALVAQLHAPEQILLLVSFNSRSPPTDPIPHQLQLL